MKSRRVIVEMQVRIERETEGWEKGLLLMALEWALDQTPSTSLGLEEWLNERNDRVLNG